MRRPLLIGVGMDMAGDDTVGREIAQRLRGHAGFDVAETHGMAADLVTLMEGRDRVLIVDACRSGAPPGTIHRLNATSGALPPFLNTVSSHGMGVAEAVRLGQSLGMLPPHCDIWAIEGAVFRPGAPLSPPVAEAADSSVATIPGVLTGAEPPPRP